MELDEIKRYKMITAFKKHRHSHIVAKNFKQAFNITKQPCYEYRGRFKREFITAVYSLDRYPRGVKINGIKKR